MKLRVFITFLMLLALEGAGYAAECVVQTEGSLTNLLKKISDTGDCRTDSYEMRGRYSKYIQSDGPFYVIRFDKNAEIYVDSLPPLGGKDGLPLVIVVDKGRTVRIIGEAGASGDGIIIRGDGGSVVLDNLTIEGFGGNGITVESDKNLMIDLKVKDNGHGIYIQGAQNVVVGTEVAGSGGDGIRIGPRVPCGSLNPATGKGDGTKVIDTVLKDNGGYGIFVNADKVMIDADGSVSEVEGAGLAGVYIESDGKACLAAGSGMRPRKAIVSKTTFIGNSIQIAGDPIPPPEGVANVAGAGAARIVGRLPYQEAGPFWLINPDSVMIDVYKAGSAGEPSRYVGTVKGIKKEDGSFELTPGGDAADLAGPLVAIAIDPENWQTSMPSGRRRAVEGGLLKPTDDDADGDGLKDADEGTLKTDPIDPDTDNDGLMDGEEVSHTGPVKEVSNPSLLDPINPDSDGDCLPDGLEVGVTPERLETLRANEKTKAVLTMNTKCQAILSGHKVLDLANAIWIDEFEIHSLENVSALYDTDPQTVTDPTLADSDGDGLGDGVEDWNLSGKRDEEETDPLLKDSDGDELIDGEEGDVNGNGELDKFESSPVKGDTDDDGIKDGDEKRKGTLTNSCDSDGDGMPDGLESGIIHPLARDPLCRGLQTAGSNFAHIAYLNPTNSDSDGDGLKDGDEDQNSNGWLDAGETDPTSEDSDSDGIDDYVELTGDLDGDAVLDIDPYTMKNGPECSPPVAFKDADCDGYPNAMDDDSDNDGCMDRDESIRNDGNSDGIPDPYDSKTASCGGGGAPPQGGGSPAPASGEAEPPEGAAALNAALIGNPTGGGACALVAYNTPSNSPYNCLIMLVILMISMIVVREAVDFVDESRMSSFGRSSLRMTKSTASQTKFSVKKS